MLGGGWHWGWFGWFPGLWESMWGWFIGVSVADLYSGTVEGLDKKYGYQLLIYTVQSLKD